MEFPKVTSEMITIIGSVFASWVSLQVSVGVLKSKVERLEKDIDGIAEFVGTPRALAKKTNQDEE